MIQGLLLAAGKGKRFGGQKLLACLPDNQYLAMASAASLCNSVDSVAAIVNSEDLALADTFTKAHIAVITCHQSKLGMGHSIACGVAATLNAQGWIVALADMPFIHVDTIHSVVDALKKGALIAAPVFQGIRGHPVGFSRHLSTELLQLKGDIGARSLLAQYQSSIVEIHCQDSGIVTDIDTPQDLNKFAHKF